MANSVTHPLWENPLLSYYMITEITTINSVVGRLALISPFIVPDIWEFWIYFIYSPQFVSFSSSSLNINSNTPPFWKFFHLTTVTSRITQHGNTLKAMKYLDKYKSIGFRDLNQILFGISVSILLAIWYIRIFDQE